jgi:hypothetical protein
MPIKHGIDIKLTSMKDIFLFCRVISLLGYIGSFNYGSFGRYI